MCRESVQNQLVTLQSDECLDCRKPVPCRRFREMLETVARCLSGLLVRLSDSSPTPGTKITDLPTSWCRVNRSGLPGGSDAPGPVQCDGAFAERFLGRCLARSWRIRDTLSVAPRALAEWLLPRQSLS
jgi:hypothetical protein